MTSLRLTRQRPQARSLRSPQWQRTQALATARQQAAYRLVLLQQQAQQGEPEAMLSSLHACAEMLRDWLVLRASEAQLQELERDFPSLGSPEAAKPPKPFVLSAPLETAPDSEELTPVQLRYRRGRALKHVRRSSAEALVALSWASVGTEEHDLALARCAVALRDYLLTAATSRQLEQLLEEFPSLRKPLHLPPPWRSDR